MRLLRKILFPFSLIYSGITSVRNSMYDKGILKSQSFDFPVICVGNLSVGGTGKSPMIEYLISLLKDQTLIGTLSRGYKRETKGFQLLKGNESARQVGDEPLQFKSKFPEIRVAVDEERLRGIQELRKLQPVPEVVLLDDAFQHRKVSAGLNILLTSFQSLYPEDQVLPTGNLRETKSGARRAHLVVVTKSPLDLKEDQKERVTNKLDLHPDQSVYFSGIAYSGRIVNGTAERTLTSLRGRKFILVTGIANPEPLVGHLKAQGLEFEHHSYPDHHNFKTPELEKLKQHPLILTTEKDFMRLKDHLKPENLFYLPMEMVFLSAAEKEAFDRAVREFIT